MLIPWTDCCSGEGMTPAGLVNMILPTGKAIVDMGQPFVQPMFFVVRRRVTNVPILWLVEPGLHGKREIVPIAQQLSAGALGCGMVAEALLTPNEDQDIQGVIWRDHRRVVARRKPESCLAVTVEWRDQDPIAVSWPFERQPDEIVWGEPEMWTPSGRLVGLLGPDVDHEAAEAQVDW